MATRIDEVRVEIDFNIEFEGGGTEKFTVPPEHPLVAQILQYRHEQVLAAAKAEGGPALGIL